MNITRAIARTPVKMSLATVAAGALALTSASPAMARDRDDDGIGAGEVIAGAVILGGLAAILSSGDRDRDRYRDGYRYRDRDYRPRARQRRGGNGRLAVERCVRAVERDARRAGFRYANVTRITDVDRERRGWEIEGRLVVDGQRGYRGGRYNNRRGYDRRGYDRGDRGRFSCDIRRGRIVDIDYGGIRGL
ncbi:MAG: hypothetical protein WA908_02995 [Pontixanthobacter sp.]